MCVLVKQEFTFQYNKYKGGVDSFDENLDALRIKEWWFSLSKKAVGKQLVLLRFPQKYDNNKPAIIPKISIPKLRLWRCYIAKDAY